MWKLLASCKKDLLLLWRDRAGLLVLFLMPLVLVIVVALVQNNVLQATGENQVTVLFVDEDQGNIGLQLQQTLEQNPGIALQAAHAGEPLTRTRAQHLINAGTYQFGIVLPSGLSTAFERDMRRQVGALLGFGSGDVQVSETRIPQIQLLFDPAVQSVFRTAVTSSLEYAVLGLESRQKGRLLQKSLGQNMGRNVDDEPSRAGALLKVKSAAARESQGALRPNAVQHNVPAWALFGMFFIVVPLAGALLRERHEGTLSRLLTLPVSYRVLLAGKLGAYVGVCMLQFMLMLVAGRYVLPLFGTPMLELGPHPEAVFILGLSAALAACGYGLMLGTLARSYDQAAMFGAVSVVIAAAIGGVMVPVYVMPAAMQTLSHVSPLAWGLNGFVDLFVRGGDLRSVVPNVAALLAFFATTSLVALGAFVYHSRRGG
ncbi:MAG: ABC transporter permease [Desulfuromonadaceae bacterium]